VIYLDDNEARQILLLAPDLLGQSLKQKLYRSDKSQLIALSTEELLRHPDLVVWCLESIESASSIEIEIDKLHKRWQTSALLIIVPESIKIDSSQLLQFECSGLLQDPTLEVLEESIQTILKGGRIVRLKEISTNFQDKQNITIGLGQWLLISGIQQINSDLFAIDKLLTPPPSNPIVSITLYGRKRELKQAKALLNLLWGPPLLNIEAIPCKLLKSKSSNPEYKTNITLKDKSVSSIWQEIFESTSTTIDQVFVNSTNTIFAIDALKTSLKRNLLDSLLTELNLVINKLQNSSDSSTTLEDMWIDLQIEIKQQAIRNFIGTYNRIFLNGEQVLLSEELVKILDFTTTDEEIPNSSLLLDPLIKNKPFLVDGDILPPDNPRSILKLEVLVNNWLIRTAELISSELLNAAAAWPELRHKLLQDSLNSTRELERLRNQLNTQNQWQSLINKPIRLYESKRLMYTIKEGKIITLLINESRDKELRNLGWWQQQVALLVEARDAISPQIQSLIKYIGDLMVIILTKVIGRAIGLIGKGIAQGMGRTLSKG
tara:strand:- start:6390 stop:8027 length:1638 start_codon:yes stop_codon:yes gene_type:complete